MGRGCERYVTVDGLHETDVNVEGVVGMWVEDVVNQQGCALGYAVISHIDHFIYHIIEQHRKGNRAVFTWNMTLFGRRDWSGNKVGEVEASKSLMLCCMGWPCRWRSLSKPGCLSVSGAIRLRTVT